MLSPFGVAAFPDVCVFSLDSDLGGKDPVYLPGGVLTLRQCGQSQRQLLS